jgi:hypothetical protein
MRKHEILPQQRIIGRPFCELCKSQMWLACIEPDEPGYDRRTFECPGCPNVTVRIVKYRATGSSPPNQLDAWYSTRQRPLPIRPLTEGHSEAARVAVRSRNRPRSAANLSRVSGPGAILAIDRTTFVDRHGRCLVLNHSVHGRSVRERASSPVSDVKTRNS